MKITGTVVDESGKRIPGANVSSQTYADVVVATDASGNFVLDSEKITDISPMKVSYVGFKDYKPLARDLNGKKITLVQDVIALNDVVITPNKAIADIPSQSSAGMQNVFVSNIKNNKAPLYIAGAVGLLIIGTIIIVKNLK